ncbi:two-component system CitB family sensor kinase [Williamsia limnetica]|uniref:Sensor-like histidine kinase SenX3 n=2 Tax=Williamsia limnetica TaxID=882452 RepID=A0A318S094_WILLI|nr:two-component system CitB family sensor kinase [Williamsia limnetica]
MAGAYAVVMRLRNQVLLLQVVVIAVSLAAGFGVVISTSDDRLRDEYGQRALAIARTVATDTDVREAVASSGGTALDPAELVARPLQAEALAVATRTDALFVVIANDQGIRLAHPDPAELAQPLSTDPSRALAGQEDLATDRGTLGQSVRAKVPIYAPGGTEVVGLVSVGISTEEIADDLRGDIGTLVLIALSALSIGVVGSALLARRWRRLTLGLEPDQLAELVREQEAVLHSMGEGVVAIDPSGVVRVINDKARLLLGVAAPTGSAIDAIGLTPRVLEVARTPVDIPRSATVADRVVLVSSHRVVRDGKDLGMVLSVVDRTDVEDLTRQVDSIRSMTDALRAQRHESANRMHVVAGLLRQGNAAAGLDYLDEVMGTGPYGTELPGLENLTEPHLRAFLEAKAAAARERGVTLTLGDQTFLDGTLRDPVVVTTAVGNLIDNSIEAASGRAIDAASGRAIEAVVEVELIADEATLLVTVADSGPGIGFADPDSVFVEGVTTHDDPAVPGGRGMGLALARQLARRTGGDLIVGDPGGEGAATDNTLGGAVFVARLPGIVAPAGPA